MQCNAMQCNTIQCNLQCADELMHNAGDMLTVTYLAVCSIVVSSSSPATCAWSVAPVLHHHPPILPCTCDQHTNVKLLAVKVSLIVYFCTFKNEPCLCKVPTKLTLPVFRQLLQSVPAINTLTFLVVCQLLQPFPAPASNTQMQSIYWLLRKASSLRKCRDV